MIVTTDQNAEFDKILQAEKLADMAQFYAPDFCDEVPLYSRYKQLSFLKKMGLEEENKVLLAWALSFLDRLLAESDPTRSFFAALTIWEDDGDDNEPIVPNVFVCNEPKDLLKGLKLHEAKGPFSKSIDQLLARISATAHSKYQLLEDRETLPDKARVFIGPRRPPYPAFVTLDSLRK